MYDNSIMLHWDQMTCKHTIPLDLYTNTAIIFSASGFQKATALASEIQEEEEHKEYIELLELGVERERLKTENYGHTQPIISDNVVFSLPTATEKEAANQKNRRVEIKVVEVLEE